MTYYRNSGPALGILTILLLAYLSMLVHGTLSRDRGKIEEQRLDLVTQLGLSDLSLFTEARYTRHPLDGRPSYRVSGPSDLARSFPQRLSDRASLPSQQPEKQHQINK